MTTTLEIGDAVRASVGGGLFVHGEVLELRGEEAKVRGRWVPLSGIITEEALEDKKHEAARTESRLRIAEQTARLEAEAALRCAPKVPVMLPMGGSYSDFVSLLNNIGYYFDVRVREDGIDTANQQYGQWSGEILPGFAVYVHTNPEAWAAVEWRVLATVPEGIAFPFDTAVAGTLGRGHSINSALLGDGGRLTINCESIVEQLVRSGLRVRKENRDK